MKLKPIKKEHILQSADFIDQDGIPNNYLHNNYWVKIPGNKEYPFKHLIREAYRIATGKKDSKLKFPSNDLYRDYVKSLGFDIEYYKEQLSFFSRSELKHFKSLAGTPYSKDDPKDVVNGKLLKPLTRKLNCWAERSLVENFELKNKDTGWQWGRKIKNYLWLRIYREGDSKKVFFIIGINSEEELYVELNCLRDDYADGSTDALSPEKISEFDNYLKLSEYQIKIIGGEKLMQYNWDRLITEAQDYIYDFGALYDELEKLVTDGESPGIERDSLIESDAPAKTKSHVKKGKTFIGSRTDWGKKQKTSKVLGDEGEKLVMKYECEKLKKSGLHKEAELVQKKLDGEGYDILSYDENGKEIHIEVKTTKGGIDEPFYMSENEKVYFEQKSMNYRLYRLYNFKFPTKTAKFYILTAEQLDNADFNSLNYEVVLSEIEKGEGG